jgi:hypothetical protein
MLGIRNIYVEAWAKYANEYTCPRSQPIARRAKRKGRNPFRVPPPPQFVAYAARCYAATALAFLFRAPWAGKATIDFRFARWHRPHDSHVTSSR